MSKKKTDGTDIVMAAALLLAEVNPERLSGQSGPGKSVYVPKKYMAMLLAEFEEHAPEILQSARELRAARHEEKH